MPMMLVRTATGFKSGKRRMPGTSCLQDYCRRLLDNDNIFVHEVSIDRSILFLCPSLFAHRSNHIEHLNMIVWQSYILLSKFVVSLALLFLLSRALLIRNGFLHLLDSALNLNLHLR